MHHSSSLKIIPTPDPASPTPLLPSIPMPLLPLPSQPQFIPIPNLPHRFVVPSPPEPLSSSLLLLLDIGREEHGDGRVGVEDDFTARRLGKGFEGCDLVFDSLAGFGDGSKGDVEVGYLEVRVEKGEQGDCVTLCQRGTRK